MPTKLELAYIAGFVDGDGCINRYRAVGRSGKVYWYPRISASQNTPDVIYWLQSRLGGKVQMRSARNNKLSNNDAFIWREGRKEKVLDILEELLPYLRVKRQAAEDLLAEFRTVTTMMEVH